MVREQAVRNQPHGPSSERLLKDPLESPEVALLIEKRRSADGPIHDVEHHSSRRVSQWSRHPGILPKASNLVHFGGDHLFRPIFASRS